MEGNTKHLTRAFLQWKTITCIFAGWWRGRGRARISKSTFSHLCPGVRRMLQEFRCRFPIMHSANFRSLRRLINNNSIGFLTRTTEQKFHSLHRLRNNFDEIVEFDCTLVNAKCKYDPSEQRVHTLSLPGPSRGEKAWDSCSYSLTKF